MEMKDREKQANYGPWQNSVFVISAQHAECVAEREGERKTHRTHNMGGGFVNVGRTSCSSKSLESFRLVQVQPFAMNLLFLVVENVDIFHSSVKPDIMAPMDDGEKA